MPKSPTPPLLTRVERLEQEISRLREADRRAARNERIGATMQWISAAAVPEDVLVSVVMSTRDRATCLERAIASVQAQSYPRWELVIADHASGDRTPEILRALEDSRISHVRIESASRIEVYDRLLDMAQGAIVAYLDDDNAMHSEWLRSVVWAFSSRPEAEVLYGAHVVENGDLEDGHPLDFFPHVHFEPWSRERLERGMITDSSAIAHRAGLPEARGGVELNGYVDWDRLLRLTRERPALALPAIATLYAEDQAGRVSDQVDFERERAVLATAYGLPDAPAYTGGRLGLLRRIKALELRLGQREATVAALQAELEAGRTERAHAQPAGDGAGSR